MALALNAFEQADLVERFDVLQDEANETRQALLGALQNPDSARALIRTALAKLDTLGALITAGRAEFAEQ